MNCPLRHVVLAGLALLLVDAGPAAPADTPKDAPTDRADQIAARLKNRGAIIRRGVDAAGKSIVVELDLNSLFGSGLSDDDARLIAQLSTIQNLQLGGCRLTDSALKELAALNYLRVLNLGGTKITDAGLKELQRLPQLEDLWLGGTAISDAGLKHLASVKSL
ncbi:MAG: hypothetical protein JNM56_14800, partial [Planctomycetia bacterium]|nr:hypothetical protein [Planctomycetia bacterium]